MTILSLLAILKEKDVRLELIANNLKIDAPKGALTPEFNKPLKRKQTRNYRFPAPGYPRSGGL